MDDLLYVLLLNLVTLVLGMVIAFFVIRGAVISAQRHARREAYTEDNMPENASWLTDRQKGELRRVLDARTAGDAR